ncbi:MAG: hypothetical protein IJZ96_07375 [Lachnospiraceae bacterium]|nr:hypothetical protein [Lachnospiraceae bacterium]
MKSISMKGITMKGISMKRIKLMGIIVILSLFAVGCTKTIELTDEESKLVAEYAAELLLKYDRNNDSKYYNDEYSDRDPFATTEYVTTEALTTEAVTTEVAATEVATTEMPELDDGSQGGLDVGTGDGEQLESEGVIDSNSNTTENVSGIVADAGKDYDLAELFGIDSISIKYEYYMVLDEYPSYDRDGVFITIEAPQGYKLVVLKFKLENKTNDDQFVDLYSKDIDYRIIIDDSKSAKQMLTILMDDLYTYEGTVEGSMYKEAVLLFQVSDDIALNMQDVKLKSIYNDQDVIISLQ